MLNALTIKQHLKKLNVNIPLQLHLFDSIDSTNRFLKDLIPNNGIDVCCAESQTHGRGRFGRTWYSPFGENIYFSIRWHFNRPFSQLSGLSLVVSMAIMAVLQDLNIQGVQIKWPNDLLWQDKKLCGSLIEALNENHEGSNVIIGIGLNVNATPNDIDGLNRPACSLYEIGKKKLDRNSIIAKLIMQLNAHLEQFINQGFASFIPFWQKNDYLFNQIITLHQPTGALTGRVLGISETGQLRLKTKDGVVHEVSSGETSLRQM